MLQNAEQACGAGRQQSIQLIQQSILRNACTPAFCVLVSNLDMTQYRSCGGRYPLI